MIIIKSLLTICHSILNLYLSRYLNIITFSGDLASFWGFWNIYTTTETIKVFHFNEDSWFIYKPKILILVISLSSITRSKKEQAESQMRFFESINKYKNNYNDFCIIIDNKLPIK